MKANRKIKIVLITAMILLVVLAGTAAITGVWKNAATNNGEIAADAVTDKVMDEAGKPTGDDPWNEMKKLVDNYYGGGQQVTFTGKMKLFDDNEDESTLIEERSFSYSMCAGQFYYMLGSIECVKQRNFIMLVNHDDKSIAVSAIIPGSGKDKGMMDFEKFKDIMSNTNVDAEVTQTGTEKVITVNNLPDPTIQGYQVFYDPITYKVHKIIVGMIRLTPLDQLEGGLQSELGTVPEEGLNDGDDESTVKGYSYKLEIIYETNEVTRGNESTFHPEKKFIIITGNHIDPTEAFKNYQLVD
jgi:hypothetical protein